ncbi:succinyl-CoA synthetase, alpha subunit, partial [mine drainage metagenome]
MSVLVDAGTKVVVQGITGHQGTVHTRQMKLFGTAVVAGVDPREGRHDRRRDAGLRLRARRRRPRPGERLL